MLKLVTAELALLLLVWVLFMFLLTFTRINNKIQVVQWWKEPVGLQLMGVAFVGALEALALLAAATQHAPPLWVFVIVFGVIDVIAARWLWLTWKSRQPQPHFPERGKSHDGES